MITSGTSGTPAVSLTQIGADNRLHIAVGVVQDSDAQDPNSDFGKLYNVVIDPFAGAGSGIGFLPELIGDGIRQPGGAGQIGDQTLLADQGAEVEHEITLYPEDARPIDFGWPDREGTQAITENAPDAVNGPTLVYPVGENTFEGQGIIAGKVYSGSISELEGRYIFGDVDGSVYSIPVDVLTDGFLHNAADLERRNSDFEPDAGTIDSPIGFATDGNGGFFILDSDGELFRVDGA